MRVAANGKALVEDRKRGHGLDRRFTAMLRVARLRVCFEVPARGEAAGRLSYVSEASRPLSSSSAASAKATTSPARVHVTCELSGLARRFGLAAPLSYALDVLVLV